MTDEYSMLYILEQLSTLKQIINYDDFDVDGPTITFFKEYLNLYQQMMTMHCNNEQETNGSNYKTKKVWGLFEFDQVHYIIYCSILEESPRPTKMI